MHVHSQMAQDQMSDSIADYSQIFFGFCVRKWFCLQLELTLHCCVQAHHRRMEDVVDITMDSPEGLSSFAFSAQAPFTNYNLMVLVLTMPVCCSSLPRQGVSGQLRLRIQVWQQNEECRVQSSVGRDRARPLSGAALQQ